MAAAVKKPLVVVVGQDVFLSNHLGRIITGQGLRCIRTDKMERITNELKRPGRIVIIDMKYEVMKERGLLRRLINIGSISGNKVICVCPNDEEDLKKLSVSAGAWEVFIRYDIELGFKDCVAGL